MILGAWGALAPVWGRVSKVVSTKKNFYSKPVSQFGDMFRTFRDFLTLDFSFIFEVTLDSELYALWYRNGAQKETDFSAISGKGPREFRSAVF